MYFNTRKHFELSKILLYLIIYIRNRFKNTVWQFLLTILMILLATKAVSSLIECT